MIPIVVGQEVRYEESYREKRWVRVGTAVEIGEGRNAGRVRVRWIRRERSDGTISPEDDKRTWVKACKLR